MPVGHARFNEKEANPNADITFISVLKQFEDHESALWMLRSIAAQFKPITKSWGFGVNSLTEYEWNPEFAGRNWNAGEIIELVLRRRDGTFLPYGMILMVMCHELAHIAQMNHGPDFWKVNYQLRHDLRELRQRHYFGDGFWSDGHSLTTIREMAPEESVNEDDMPSMTCGGAIAKSRNKKDSFQYDGTAPVQKKRKRARTAKPSLHTGVQTSTGRVPGSRIRSQTAFKGEGKTVDEEGVLGSTFRKQAGSKKARDERLAAIEARLNKEREEKGMPPLDGQPKIESSLKTTTPTKKRAKSSASSPSSSSSKGSTSKRQEEIDSDEIDELDSDDGADAILAYDEEERQRLREDLREWVDKRSESKVSKSKVSTSNAATSSSSGASTSKGKGKQVEVLVLDDSD